MKESRLCAKTYENNGFYPELNLSGRAARSEDTFLGACLAEPSLPIIREESFIVKNDQWKAETIAKVLLFFHDPC